MTTSRPYNDQIPTDPTMWAVLLLTAGAVIGQLTSEQTTALIELLQLIGGFTPLLLLGRR